MHGPILLVSQNPELLSRALRLNHGVYVLGRSAQCDYPLNDPTISRKHAELDFCSEKWAVRDLASLNGTFWNGTRISSCELEIGGQLRLGRIIFLVTESTAMTFDSDSEQETTFFYMESKETQLNATVDGLSPGQRRIFDLLLAGLAEKKIAAQLGLSPHTVHNHVRAIYRALGVHSRPEMLAQVLK